MTDRPRLTIAEIERHQDEKGARKYPTPLADAGLSVGALLLHGVEESVDRRRYFMLAGIWTSADEEQHADIIARALPFADHPKPLPPDVPTVEAVATYGEWWQFGDVVVELDDTPVGLQFYHPGWRDSESIDPTDPRWRGPITLRP